jgi:hypothetical protein
MKWASTTANTFLAMQLLEGQDLRTRIGGQPLGLGRLTGLRRYSGTPPGTWGGLATDGSCIYVEDTSVQEIYSLQLRQP